MRVLSVWLICVLFLNADELDIFNVLDSQNNTTQTVDTSSINSRIKLSYLVQDSNKNSSVLYTNITDNTKHFFYGMRLVANENSVDLHIKDIYFKTDIDEKYFFELGRVNIKEGVARGYNPTDYFKENSSFTLSVDPKDKRENRLGSLLLQSTVIADDFTVKVLYSPKISTSNKSIWGNKKHFGLNLQQTNSQGRATLYLSYTGLDDWSTSILLHYNDLGLHTGLNLSYIQDRTIIYMETSLNKKEDQISQVLKSIDAPTALIETFDDKEKYRSEISMGLNYTFENSIVTTFEYIYNSAGLSKKEWQNYFDIMRSNSQYAPILGTARGVVATKSQILSEYTLFTMIRKNDAVPNLDWVAMGWINPIDKSALAQVGLGNDYKDVLFCVDVRTYFGNNKSEYGSMKNRYEALLSVEYFF